MTAQHDPQGDRDHPDTVARAGTEILAGKSVDSPGPPGGLKSKPAREQRNAGSETSQVEGSDRAGVGSVRTISLANLVTCAALSLLMGGAGAWAFQSFLARPPDPKVARSDEEPTRRRRAPDAALADLTARLDDLSGGLREIRQYVDAWPQTSTPPDLMSLEDRIVRSEKTSQDVVSLARRLDVIAARVDKNRSSIRANQEAIARFPGRLASLRGTAEAATSASDRDDGHEETDAGTRRPPQRGAARGKAT